MLLPPHCCTCHGHASSLHPIEKPALQIPWIRCSFDPGTFWKKSPLLGKFPKISKEKRRRWSVVTPNVRGNSLGWCVLLGSRWAYWGNVLFSYNVYYTRLSAFYYWSNAFSVSEAATCFFSLRSFSRLDSSRLHTNICSVDRRQAGNVNTVLARLNWLSKLQKAEVGHLLILSCASNSQGSILIRYIRKALFCFVFMQRKRKAAYTRRARV